MKQTFRLVIVPAALAAGFVLGMSYSLLRNGGEVPRHARTTRAGLTIERVRELSALTTVRADVADAQVTELLGNAGGVKAVLIVRGDVSVGVDLSAARFEKVDPDARSAVLVLPPPRVQSARVDHERTRLIGLYPSGLWAVTPGGGDADAAAVNLAYRDAERAVAGAADEPALVERARRQAEAVLRAFTGALGWDVIFRWEG